MSALSYYSVPLVCSIFMPFLSAGFLTWSELKKGIASILQILGEQSRLIIENS